MLFIITLTDFNSCSRPNVEGEVNGKELTYEDFETQVRNEENLETLLLGSISEEEKNNIRLSVWNRFVAPAARSSSSVRNPQQTAAPSTPALRAVSTSTSLSPT